MRTNPVYNYFLFIVYRKMKNDYKFGIIRYRLPIHCFVTAFFYKTV